MNPLEYAWIILKDDVTAPDEDESFEWPSTEIKPRKENPVSMPDPFRMQKPQMQSILDHIAEELARRGGFMEKPSEPTSGDNPMFRHTRAEMLAAQKQIEDEQSRRKTNRGVRRTLAEKAKEFHAKYGNEGDEVI
tara:strand:+ start:20731 stop:21135 length:405 start_codon:yes stop_codon:yes gene_type:complete